MPTSRILENGVKARAARGERSYGVLFPWVAPDLVELFGHAGFDWLFIDAEHGCIGRESCEILVRACNVVGMTPIVRVPEAREPVILSYLEAGALGLIVPHINTADDAREAVAATQYGPAGHRGACSTSRIANYGVTQTPNEYFAAANNEITVIALIEEKEGLDNLDQILAVEGLFGVSIGPGDLAMSMGLPGQIDHPDVQRAVQDAQRRVVASGKVLSTCIADASGKSTQKFADVGSLMIGVRAATMLGTMGRQFLEDAKGGASAC
ncbi:MAG: HpcH/HpaI aldolase/citrate lyase family protein [Acidimicrobiia bacterium]